MLDKKDKPVIPSTMKLDFSRTNPPENNIIIKISHFTFSYAKKMIFNNIDFIIENR